MRPVHGVDWISFLLLILCQLFDVCQSASDLGVSREDRFPSAGARVKLYMSNWYVPPCHDYSDGSVRYSYRHDGPGGWPIVVLKGLQNHPMVNSSAVMEVENIIEPDMLFYLNLEIINNCANLSSGSDSKTPAAESRQLMLADRVKFQQNMRMYCVDVAYSVVAALDHVQWEMNPVNTTGFPPMLLQFGDNGDSHKFGNVIVPHIKKFRSSATSPSDLTKVTSQACYSTPRDILSTFHGQEKLQPIVWKLATHRHFEKLQIVNREDTPWSKKQNMAVFRGQLTGSKYGFNKTLSDEENCLRLMRCRLVYNHANSTLVNARLTSTRKRLPSSINNVILTGGKVSLNTLLQYKGIIMLEGNDVASGLKWALLSQSIVLMPPPKHTSWAMEELLEPWVVSGTCVLELLELLLL
jgi:hypothetical protein